MTGRRAGVVARVEAWGRSEFTEISDISTNSRSRMRLTGRDAAGLKGPDRAREYVGMAELEDDAAAAAASSSSP